MAYNETMKFAPYEYREYPKWVETGEKNGQPTGVVVQDEEEEAQVKATLSAPVRDADERARLILLAETKGVQIDKRWSLDRMAKAIDEAGFDSTFDPNV